MQPAHMLVPDADRVITPKLPLDLQTALFGICILHVAVHRRKIEQNARRDRQTAEDIRKDRRSRLRGRKADADLAQVGRILSSFITMTRSRIRDRSAAAIRFLLWPIS